MIHLLSTIVDLTFPSRCVICNENISLYMDCICQDCLKKIKYIDNGCIRCSGSIDGVDCRICSDREFYLKKNISIAEYSGVIKEILHSYKFNNRKRLYIHLGRIALNELSGNGIVFDLLTSVPLNRKKKWKRGFNQSELISKFISKRLKIPYSKVLKENPRSFIQKDLGYRDRFINVLDKYAVFNAKIVNNKRILIIDDVFTTGATLNECARTLLKSGASEVFSLTIARASIKKT